RAWLLLSLCVVLSSACAQQRAQAPTAAAPAAQTAQAQASPVPALPQMPEALTARHVLRVCADPNNLPFSNERGEGLENKLAELVARDLGAQVEYTWWAQRRGFFRNTLKAGACDVVMGVPAAFEMALTTSPYYRSTYVFVSRAARKLDLHSFDDPILRELKIGVQMIGDDFANTPPAHALANRHILQNVQGYMIYGDYREANPPARIITAVERGEIDTAIVWGPLGGYFARHAHTPLAVVPVTPQIDQPFLPFVYDISVGVRRGEQEFRDKLDEILTRRRPEIDKLLDDYGVPQVKG
ncbi:MAG TPA: substrate-binding domain-containing protein, partial [Pyrinomonadaceae bacterium]|nr:substrate-binding domain-containing protein [Pyrinomonadaceae bacterium]